MDVVYSGEHSLNLYAVTLTSTVKRNTWSDFHLIPSERPSITYPAPNTRIVPIPGTSKRLDITDYHIGGLTYGARTGTWEFYIDHNRYTNWKEAYDSLVNFANGKELYVALSDEPSLFYKGIFTVPSYVAGSSYSKISIQYDLGYDSMILKEVELGDGIVSLLTYCPVNFIGENGSAYATDYGLSSSANYYVEIGGLKEVRLRDLISLGVNGG